LRPILLRSLSRIGKFLPSAAAVPARSVEA
jgi:hypothetical protein